MYRPDWADENFEPKLLSCGLIAWVRKKNTGVIVEKSKCEKQFYLFLDVTTIICFAAFICFVIRLFSL